MTKTQTQLPVEIPNRLVVISNGDCDIIITTILFNVGKRFRY